MSLEETATTPSGVSATLLLESVTAPTETSTPPAVTVKDDGDCSTSGVATTPPTSTTGCDGVSRLRESGDSGSGGIVDEVVVVTGTVDVVVGGTVVVVVVVVGGTVVVVVDVVVVDATTAETRSIV